MLKGKCTINVKKRKTRNENRKYGKSLKKKKNVGKK